MHEEFEPLTPESLPRSRTQFKGPSNVTMGFLLCGSLMILPAVALAKMVQSLHKQMGINEGGKHGR